MFTKNFSHVVLTRGPLYNLAAIGNTIIDQYGNEVFALPDDATKIVGYTEDGKFILLKHTDASFDKEGSDYFYIMDSNLEPQETGIACTKTIDPLKDNAEFLSDGLYYFAFSDNLGAYLNLNNSSWLYGGADYLNLYRYKNIVGYNSKYAVIENRGLFYLIPISRLAAAHSPAEIEAMLKDSEFLFLNDESKNSGLLGRNLQVNGYIKNWLISDWQGNSLLREVYEYGGSAKAHFFEFIDMDGNIIFEYPDFSEGVSYEDVDDFSGGFSAIYLKGVDKQWYAAIVDETGNLQYDPVSCGDDNCSFNGYIISYQRNDTTKVITPTGEQKSFGDDLSGLSNGRYSHHSDNYSVAISDGYIYFCAKNSTPVYAACDGSRLIEKVYANYNYAGQLVFDDKAGTVHISSSVIKEDLATEDNGIAKESDALQKSYIIIDNFSIEGKWKNVGTYTFGQVQSGAIVAFDGANCNVYSPLDTYALYKDGDNYRLDTTSPLGETISFTVKIVDKNNIDVFYDSQPLELTRVG